MRNSFEPVQGKTRESKSRDTNRYNLGGKVSQVEYLMINKLAKLRRHASRVHFAKIHFGEIHFGKIHLKNTLWKK